MLCHLRLGLPALREKNVCLMGSGQWQMVRKPFRELTYTCRMTLSCPSSPLLSPLSLLSPRVFTSRLLSLLRVFYNFSLLAMPSSPVAAALVELCQAVLSACSPPPIPPPKGQGFRPYILAFRQGPKAAGYPGDFSRPWWEREPWIRGKGDLG